MKRINNTLKKSEINPKQQDPWALHRKPDDPNFERPEQLIQLALPFATEDGGGSNGCTN